jgi:hypothetical protein
MLQLRALEWDAYLGARGEDRVSGRADITKAFGATWDAIVKWRGKLEVDFGEDVIRQRLETAARLGARDGYLEIGRSLEQDGEAYRRAMGYVVR